MCLRFCLVELCISYIFLLLFYNRNILKHKCFEKMINFNVFSQRIKIKIRKNQKSSDIRSFFVGESHLNVPSNLCKNSSNTNIPFSIFVLR